MSPGGQVPDESLPDRPPAEHRHAAEVASIRGQLCSIEDRAGSGYRVEREQNPPYGWNLVDAGGSPCAAALWIASNCGLRAGIPNPVSEYKLPVARSAGCQRDSDTPEGASQSFPKV